METYDVYFYAMNIFNILLLLISLESSDPNNCPVFIEEPSPCPEFNETECLGQITYTEIDGCTCPQCVTISDSVDCQPRNTIMTITMELSNSTQCIAENHNVIRCIGLCPGKTSFQAEFEKTKDFLEIFKNFTISKINKIS